MPPLRVLVADEHATMRNIVVRLIGRWGMTVIGVAGDWQQAVEYARTHRADVILFDFDTRRGGGLLAIRQIKMALPEVPLVIHSLSDDRQYRSAAYKSGADGFVSKAGSINELERVLRAFPSRLPACVGADVR